MRCEAATLHLISRVYPMGRRPSRQKIIMVAYFVFQNGCLATRRREKKKQRRTRAAQQRELSARCAPQRRPSMLICRSGGPKSAMELPSLTRASPPACIEHALHRLLNIAMIRYCGSGMIGLCGGARDNKPSLIAAP